MTETGTFANLELTVHAFHGLPTTAAISDEPLEFNGPTEQQQYEVLAKLGEGAMGSVHLVKDVRLQRQVAFKQLLSQWQDAPGLSQRFLSEVQITAQLPHPYIVPVYGLEMTKQGIGYTMKRVQGKTFKELILAAKEQLQAQGKRSSPYDLPLMLEQFLKVCDALAYAHFRQVIHRDLKPANLMLGDHNEVYVMDWGIARPFGTQAADYPFEAEEKDRMIGTPRYMSPEQARGANHLLDGRSDLFALGLILYEIVCLKPAYQASNATELLEKVRKAAIEDIRADDIKVPPPLQAIIRKATAWKRAERYANVSEFANDIRRYLRDQVVLAAKDTPIQALLRWTRHHRTLCLSGLLACVVFSGSFSLWNLFQQQQAQQAAYAHEQVLAGFWGQVLKQGQNIDRYLLVIPRVLESVAGMGLQALQHGTPSQETYYLDDASWPTAVPRQIDSKHYNTKVSFEYSGFTIATGLTEAQLKPQLQRLAPIQKNFLNLFAESAKLTHNNQLQKLLSEGNAPFMFVSLAIREGMLKTLPGISYNTPNYDPRKRPFYKLVENQHAMKCGNPYLDRITGALLPCSLPLYNDKEEFVGVATMDMQFNYLARKVLDLSGNPAFKESYLIDEKGQVIVKASDRNRKVSKQSKLNTGFKLQPFADSELQALMKKHSDGGTLERPDKVLGYIRLNFQGWYYVVEADTQRLFGAKK